MSCILIFIPLLYVIVIAVHQLLKRKSYDYRM